MQKQFEKTKKQSSRFIIIIVVAAMILAAAVWIIGNVFIGQIQERVRSTSIQVISELTDNKAAMLNGLLEDGQKDVSVLASYLETEKGGSLPASALKEFCTSHGTAAVAVANKSGKFLYGSGEQLALNGIPKNFAAEVDAKSKAISDVVYSAKGKPRILIGAKTSDGGIVYAAFSCDALQSAYGESTYKNEGYSYVVAKNSEIMIPPVRYSYEQVYTTMRTLLSEEGNDSEKITDFLELLGEGKAGSAVFSFEEEKQLLCFTPLELDKDWVLITVVPLRVIEKEGSQIVHMSMTMAAIIIAAIAAVLGLGVFFYLYTQYRRRENDRFLQEIYQAISENIDTVIFIQDDQTSRLDYVFENSGRLLGIPAEELLAGGGESDSSFRKELISLLRNEHADTWNGREIKRYNDRLGREMWLKVLVCPFQLRDKRKYIYAVTEVTEEHLARERITTAIVAAEQANAAKSHFLANMSHDIRTPMNAIVGMTAIAKLNLGDQEKVAECLDKIDLSSKHLLNLINDVLDMSKIESGRLTLVNEPFDLEVLLRDLEEMLRPQCETRKQNFQVSISIDHKMLLGDTVRLSQIFTNLISNAIKFTAEGGEIVVAAEEMEQKHSGFAYCRFVVTDTGIGMSSEFVKTIFDPFERAEDHTVRETEGTGLGMAITKNLVSAMGGQIFVDSEYGKGSSFTVELELPINGDGTLEKQIEDKACEGHFDYKGKRFLLAEDNELNQQIVIELLHQQGAEAEIAENGRVALERFLQCEQGYFTAILMDIQMPVMDGYEAAEAIRASQHPQAQTIPIIAMTANAFSEDIKAAKDAGMDAHISKPIDMETVSGVLNALKL